MNGELLPGWEALTATVPDLTTPMRRYLQQLDCIRTVADEYFAVTEKVESLYQQGKPLPADTIGPHMARLRREHTASFARFIFLLDGDTDGELFQPSPTP
ncbi:hypothetical protein ACFPIJ_24980 [Dactylosporangium cerinum]|uniref:Uncharacterized protein n=1 Tax=Dactylosporangium cerinum TaxID=1434730 RepID=A0ABV9W268_9ACTN